MYIYLIEDLDLFLEIWPQAALVTGMDDAGGPHLPSSQRPRIDNN